VHVSDNGEGIEDDVLPHIFEPFYTTKEEGRGTGLGLAICFGLLRRHRGTIKVQSAKGEGTTFSVYLPVMALP
jgi:signal transduction histidine kinase